MLVTSKEKSFRLLLTKVVSLKVWRKMCCSRKAKHRQMALKRHFHSKTHFGMLSISLGLILTVFFSDSMLNNGHIKLRVQLLACRGCQTPPSVFVGHCVEMRCHSLPSWHSQIKSASLFRGACRGKDPSAILCDMQRKTTRFWGLTRGKRMPGERTLSAGIFGAPSATVARQ